MEQNLTKSISYRSMCQTLIFAVLPLIDFWRNSGNGWQMMVASQSVGFVLAVIIFIHYGIRKFFKWYNLIWLFLAGAAIVSMPYWFYDEAIKYHYLYEMRLAFVTMALYGMILVQIICDYKNKRNCNKKVSIDTSGKILFLLWLFYILLATLMKDNTYRPEFDLVYFGIFYLVTYTKDEVEQLLRDLINGILVGWGVLQTIALFFRPYVDGINRYRGMYYNSNIFDLMCLVILFFIVLKMTNARRKGVNPSRISLQWMILYGVVFSLILLSVGRLSIVLAIGATLFYGTYIMLLDRIKIKHIFFKGCVLFLITCVMLPIIFISVSYLPRILKRPIVFQDEYFDMGDLNDEDNYVSFEEFFVITLGRFNKLTGDSSFEGNEESLQNSTSEEEKTDENALRDPDWENKTYYLDEKGYNAFELRWAICRTYLKETNLWGHTVDEWKIWISPNLYMVHAHNIFIMQIYVYGLIAGCLFAAWIFVYLYNAWNYWINNQKNIYAIVPLGAVLLLIIFGMFELTWMSGQISWVVVLIVQKCLLSKCSKNTEG